MMTPPQRYPRQDRSAPRLTPSVYCSLDSRLRNESGTPSPLDDGCLSYSPGSTQVHRHEVLALRFQSLSSVTFEGCLHSVARTSQARLVVPPEPFDAICCKRIFRLLLQLPTRDQVLTAFVYIQNDRQHRRPSVHFHPPGLLLPFTVFQPLCLGRSGNVSPLPRYTDHPRPAGRRRSCPQSSLPSLTAAGEQPTIIAHPAAKIGNRIHFDVVVSLLRSSGPASLRSVLPQSCSTRHAPLVANRLGLTLHVGAER